jgi:hypothetical protein
MTIARHSNRPYDKIPTSYSNDESKSVWLEDNHFIESFGSGIFDRLLHIGAVATL